MVDDRVSNRPLRVALLGYGYVGRTFHAPLIAATDGLALAAVGSSDPAKVRADLPAAEVGAARDVLARSDVDLVVVATPNATHYDLARLALLADKHVVADKPFTITLDEARELTGLARTRGRVLSVFHNLRWNGDFLTIRRLLEEGKLGRVAHFEAHFDRYRPDVRARWREQAGPGSGIWYDLGSHLVDQSLQLFGRPQEVQADLARLRPGSETVDYFHVVLHYEERRAILHGSNLVAGGSPRFVIHGDRASYVKFGQDTQEAALRRGVRPGGPGWGHDPEDGTLHPAASTGIQASHFSTLHGDWRIYYARLRDAIREGGPNPVPPEEAADVVEILELGVRSAEEGRTLLLEASPSR